MGEVSDALILNVYCLHCYTRVLKNYRTFNVFKLIIFVDPPFISHTILYLYIDTDLRSK